MTTLIQLLRVWKKQIKLYEVIVYRYDQIYGFIMKIKISIYSTVLRFMNYETGIPVPQEFHEKITRILSKYQWNSFGTDGKTSQSDF